MEIFKNAPYHFQIIIDSINGTFNKEGYYRSNEFFTCVEQLLDLFKKQIDVSVEFSKTIKSKVMSILVQYNINNIADNFLIESPGNIEKIGLDPASYYNSLIVKEVGLDCHYSTSFYGDKYSIVRPFAYKGSEKK